MIKVGDKVKVVRTDPIGWYTPCLGLSGTVTEYIPGQTLVIMDGGGIILSAHDSGALSLLIGCLEVIDSGPKKFVPELSDWFKRIGR